MRKVVDAAAMFINEVLRAFDHLDAAIVRWMGGSWRLAQRGDGKTELPRVRY
jgi:hypothetical protein